MRPRSTGRGATQEELPRLYRGRSGAEVRDRLAALCRSREAVLCRSVEAMPCLGSARLIARNCQLEIGIRKLAIEKWQLALGKSDPLAFCSSFLRTQEALFNSRRAGHPVSLHSICLQALDPGLRRDDEQNQSVPWRMAHGATYGCSFPPVYSFSPALSSLPSPPERSRHSGGVYRVGKTPFSTAQSSTLVPHRAPPGRFSWLLLFGPAKRSDSDAGRRSKARRRRAKSP